jgi:hypothetical protein
MDGVANSRNFEKRVQSLADLEAIVTEGREACAGICARRRERRTQLRDDVKGQIRGPEDENA